MTDQGSTHGTFINDEKCVPFLPKRIQNGDVVKLGTALEYTSRTTEKHLPTELEVGIVEMDIPSTTTNTHPYQPVPTSTNSFHAPLDSDSESEEEEPHLLPKLVLRPFASQGAEEFQREASSAVTSVDGRVGELAPSQPAQVPVIDLTTEETPYVAVEPVHMECVSLISDDEPEDPEEEEDEDEEEEEEYTGHVDYTFPYEYDTEDKESVNGDFQVPETQIFPAFQNPIIHVIPPQ